MKSLRWMDKGVCTRPDADPELHFPVGSETTPAYRRQAAQAKNECAACPVIAKCRIWAMGEDEGIWAGMTPNERRALRAQEARQVGELQRHQAVAAARQTASNQGAAA